MLFPCPSPTGENRLGLFLDGDGRLCDRWGRSWSSNRLALDQMPDDLRERGEEREQLEKRLHAFVMTLRNCWRSAIRDGQLNFTSFSTGIICLLAGSTRIRDRRKRRIRRRPR
jgi:hypothetical protein